MKEFEEVTIRSRHGTGPAILDTLRGKAGRYVLPEIGVTENSAGDDTITVHTYAVELVSLLVTMAEPTATVEVAQPPDLDDPQPSRGRDDPGWVNAPPFNGD